MPWPSAKTGTPVENRLSDLWSLFDFVNPGLLGTSKEFTTFSKGLADHPDGYGRLRRMTAPCILRRLKTDSSIISDLPDKVEMKSWADLSREQVLIFTQFKEMTEPLAHFLETIWRMSSGKILLWDRINIDVS